MLSRADFEDLFPDLFKPVEMAIARWEDDGGRHGDARVLPVSGKPSTPDERITRWPN